MASVLFVLISLLKNLILFSIQVFLHKYGSTKDCEIVLLTDGEDTAISSCFDEVQRSGSIIHTIALGSNATKDLETLADKTGK